MIMRHPSRLSAFAAAGLAVAAFGAKASAQTIPPVDFPPENPLTEEKRVLGKILFWDEQLSTDNTMSCGTCHQPQQAGGGDPRVAINPGPDGVVPSPDDVRGSPGVINAAADLTYDPVAFFDLRPQVTGRASPSVINAAYAFDMFWDGRARDEFVDPQTGQVEIPFGGGLESQVVGPPLSTVEMAHMDRDWNQIAAKLTEARPLALAANIPADMAAALAGNPSYPDLFASAFGDGAITSKRIAFAIATYERTLVSDQSPFDQWSLGDDTAMTPLQEQGFLAFQAGNCQLCHTVGLFTDQQFRNIGVRPAAEDIGREAVTGDPADRGRMKTPTLRNAALRPAFMHNGRFTTMTQAVDFYRNIQQQFFDNRDPFMNFINLPPENVGPIVAFMDALVDPRVAAGEFPFDRPTMFSELPPNPSLLPPNSGIPGTGGEAPRMIANIPPLLGSPDFKIGLARALAGADAYVRVSQDPPVAGEVVGGELFGPFPVEGLGTDGYATFFWPIADDGALDGEVYFMQWFVDDPNAAGGQSRSRAARVELLCGNGVCATACPADLTGEGDLNIDDVIVFLDAFATSNPAADFSGPDGVFNIDDVLAFLDAFALGCP